MKWITATELQHWAATLSARDTFPELIADLIRATAKEIQAFRFPSGNKAQVRGFDGWLLATGVPPYVPDGLSVWEFGASGANAAKAFKDFTKRTGEVSSEKQKETTLVLASPYTWDDPQNKLPDWLDDCKKSSDWKEILYIDGVQIEDWLQLCPGVSARYAAEMQLRPVEGVQSSDEFWEEYACRFKIPLTEDVLLCGREAQANDLLQGLIQGHGPIQFAADAPDEVIAFAIAAVRKAEWDTRLFLESRILVLDTQHAARSFTRDRGRNHIFFPRLQANALSGQLSSIGPTLIALGRDQSSRPGLFLNRPSTQEFSKALQSLDLPADEAENLARHCGRSIVVLARQFGAGHVSPPFWVGQGQNLIPAVLAGGWDGGSGPDCELVTSLIADKDYPNFEGGLRKFAKLQDPPIDSEGPIWKIRAPVDAFVQLAHLIGRSDLERLSAAAHTVFSELDAPVDPNAPFELPGTAPRRHSSWLRDGIANTLLQIAVLGKQADLNVPGVDPQLWVENVIAGIPGLASDHRLIGSLKNELWMLMEAAPRPLLSALGELLEGDGVGALGLFSTEDGLFAPTSPHTYVLWALETLAWDPRFLEKATTILAKLARIDPGGKTSNRPINSLRSILLSWAPNTHASLQQRLQVIDRTMEAVPEISWELLMELLPRSRDISSPTRKPKFREAGASQQEVLTYARVWEAQEYVIDRVLDRARDDGARWVDVVGKLEDWPPKQRARAFAAIDNWLSLTDQPTKAVWSALNDLVNNHMAYADAQWAMPRDDLTTLRDIVRRHQADDVVERVSWLFKDWSVQVGTSYDANDAELKQLRNQALVEVLEDDDSAELFRLVDTVGRPETVAASLADMMTGPDQTSWWIKAALTHASLPASDFARVLSAGGRNRFGDEWKKRLTADASNEHWDDEVVANLLLQFPDDADTWEYADTFSPEVKQLYWAKKYPFGLEAATAGSLDAIQNYLQVSRPAAALVASHSMLKEVSSETLLTMLRMLLETADLNDFGQMTGYYVEHVFNELDSRQDVEVSDLAQMEYAFLPIMERRPRKLVIHKLMAQDPEFYMTLIRSVFSPSSKQDERAAEHSDHQRAKWRIDYRLLSEFDTLPGQKGEAVDYDTLKAWVLEVQRLGAECDRVAITNIYIGHLLAHAPVDENETWPHTSVRRLLDALANEDIERGVMTERFNMRGVFSKSLYEGGKQEREIAQRYRQWAQASAAFPATASMLERIAESYDRDAAREDERAQLDKLRDM
ncbi:hypothetical protein [Sinorhizobium meliloti]|uniref:hypothetical protein n=1 Tax=Rhizobium meliloti TaxID=382 RepID=UPI0001E4DD8A|nr:hypothetical protein [Sinorhizobium meliloti]AEG04215.1 hypothetical protein SinmeB_1292 [Sinorhizobium meliloti BL225C]MDE4545157.1 hypothetical protein [Sinorhizobium meliloti]MDE4573821.1 hypothetical protein [Sinorhizobium meliloti]SDZ36144.1 hypothetical protein SAMN04244576_05644 [Sinorhizobium meliloti]